MSFNATTVHEIFAKTFIEPDQPAHQTENTTQSPRVVVAISISIANRGTSNFVDNLDRWIESFHPVSNFKSLTSSIQVLGLVWR